MVVLPGAAFLEGERYVNRMPTQHLWLTLQVSRSYGLK
jgi:hypothetical protein